MNNSGVDNIDLSVDLSIVIPSFNEAQGIGMTLDSLLETFPSAEIIVVDDCSTDGTYECAIEKNVRVLRHDFNKGYGASLKTGMAQAERRFIAWFDADNEHRAEDLLAMLKKITSSSLVAVVGQRMEPGASKVRTAGKWMIRKTAQMLGVEMGSDVNCGLRIFHRSAILPYLNVLPNAFSASLTSSMILIERGYPFEFFPVSLNRRIGHSKVRLADGFSTLTLVLRLVMLFAPLRIFFRGGFLLLVLGAVYGITTALIRGLGIPPASIVITLMGFLLILLGLIADQISQLRLNQLSNLSVLMTPESSKKNRED